MSQVQLKLPAIAELPVVVARSPIARADGADPVHFVNRLGELGIVDATRREALPALLKAASQPPVDSPNLLLDVPSGARLVAYGQDFLDARTARRHALYAANAGAWRALQSRGPFAADDERQWVGWAVRAQATMVRKTLGIACRLPTLDRFAVVPANDTVLQSALGVMQPESGLLLLREEPDRGELVATAAHELGHALAAMRIAFDPRRGPIVFGGGLNIRSLFGGANEAYTTDVAHRTFEDGLGDYSGLGREARQLLPKAHTDVRTRRRQRHDGSNAVSRRALQRAMHRIYHYYAGRSGEAFFVHWYDPVATMIDTFVGRAYFAGDLTFYGMLWNALGERRFDELALMQEPDGCG